MTFKAIEIIGVCVLCIISGIFIGRIRRRNSDTDSFLVRVFKDNKDFDSTLDRVLLAVIILFMLIAFHDDLTNVQTAGIVLALFNSLFAVYQSVVTGKAVRDLQQAYNNGNGNTHHGKTPSGSNH